MIKKILLLQLASLLVLNVAFAQRGDTKRSSSYRYHSSQSSTNSKKLTTIEEAKKEKITWAMKVETARDGKQYFVVIAEMDRGWHLLSQVSAGDGSLIATKFDVSENHLEANDDGTLNKTFSENGNLLTKSMEGVDDIMKYYEDKVEFRLPLANNIPKNTIKLKLTINYQLWSEGKTLTPTKISYFYEEKP